MPSVTLASFKAQFARNFTFGSAVPDVMDSDITNAIAEKDALFNFDLYPSDKPQIGILAEHYLTAHFLVMDIDAADSGGQTRLLQNSRGADGVSESVDIPDWMKESIFASTYYGQKFLMLSSPYLGGVVFSVAGGTNP
jgi:hypothetical protein